MNRFLLLALAVFVLLGCERRDAISQPTPATCDMLAWQRALPPHTERTPETIPPLLRDTNLLIRGTMHRVSLPEGFTISVFATIQGARNVVTAPDGTLYLATSSTVYALPDHNRDGIPDSSIIVCSGLSTGFGIGFCKGVTYVSDESGFYKIIDGNGDRRGESRTMLFPLSGGGNHRTRNFVIDTVAGKVYIQVGSVSNDDEDNLTDSTRGTIMTANIDGSQLHVYARGLRNAVGLDLDPRTGVLWANMNGSDNMFSSAVRTDNNPSECVYIVCEGAHYGWPYAYGYQMRNPKYLSTDTTFIQKLSGPVAEVLAHEAPLGLHFYRGSNFPAAYRNAIFQSYHGSWNRSTPAPPRVTVMWADSDGRNAHITDFINGFQPDSSSTRWGRTAGLTEGADGSLYIADDYAGVVYKVSYTGSTGDVKQAVATSEATINSIAPNPARTVIHADVTLPTWRSIAYEIVDLLGRVVHSSSTLPLGAGPQTLDVALPALSAGTYVLRIIGHDSRASKQFVVE